MGSNGFPHRLHMDSIGFPIDSIWILMHSTFDVFDLHFINSNRLHKDPMRFPVDFLKSLYVEL